MNIPDWKQFKAIIEETEGLRHRLFEAAQQPDAWKNSLRNPRLKHSWLQIRQAAERYADKPLEQLLYSQFVTFHTTGERRSYEQHVFHRMSRLHAFALMMLCEPEHEDRWKKHLEDTIWAICNDYTWVLPAHVGLYENRYPDGIWDQPQPPRETVDLQAALTAFSLAEIGTLLEGRLSPWIHYRIRDEIERRIFQVYFHDPAPQNWELKTNNWPAVCAAGIGAAAIYLVKDSERLSGMLWRVLSALQSHLKGFDQEGATSEGIGYWQFGFGHFTYFAELLGDRTGGQVQLLSGEHMRRIAQYPGACMLSAGKVINFSDAPGEVVFVHGLLDRLAHRFDGVIVPDGPIQVEPHLRYWTHTARTLLWTRNDMEDVKQSSREMSFHSDHKFEGHQWFISKIMKDGALTALAFKGGHNAEPHNHNDLGHFILHVNGETILADLGAGEYTRQYFHPDTRYSMITCGSHGHSVPVVDGVHQGTGKQFYASLLHYEVSKEWVYGRLDLTKAYPCPSLQKLERSFTWQRKKYHAPELWLEDEACFDEIPAQYEEVFITTCLPYQAASGEVSIGSVALRYCADQFDYRCEKEVYRTIDGREAEVYRMVLSCKPQMLAAHMHHSFVFKLNHERQGA